MKKYVISKAEFNLTEYKENQNSTLIVKSNTTIS